MTDSTLDGHAPGTVKSVATALRGAISEAGYVESSYDNEGRAVRLTFFTGTTTAAMVVSISPCSVDRVPFSIGTRQ